MFKNINISEEKKEKLLNHEIISNFVKLYDGKVQNTKINIPMDLGLGNIKKEFTEFILLEENKILTKFPKITKFCFKNNKLELKSFKVNEGKIEICKNPSSKKAILSDDDLSLLQYFFSKPTVENLYNYVDNISDKKYNLLYFLLNITNSHNILKKFLSYHYNDDISVTNEVIINTAILDLELKIPAFLEQAKQLQVKDIELLELIQASVLTLESCSDLNMYLNEVQLSLDISNNLFSQIKDYESSIESPLRELNIALLHKLYVLEIQKVKQYCEYIHAIIKLNDSN